MGFGAYLYSFIGLPCGSFIVEPKTRPWSFYLWRLTKEPSSKWLLLGKPLWWLKKKIFSSVYVTFEKPKPVKVNDKIVKILVMIIRSWFASDDLRQVDFWCADWFMRFCSSTIWCSTSRKMAGYIPTMILKLKMKEITLRSGVDYK